MFYTNDNMDHVKLIDLGSSDDLSRPEIRAKTNDDNTKRPQHKYFVGTAQYMAPECQHNKPTTKASDVWSLGCVLYQLHTGLTPFRGGSDYLIFKLSGNAEILRIDKLSTSVLPQAAKDLMKRMVVVEQDKRISIEEVLQDPYFDSVRDLKNCP